MIVTFKLTGPNGADKSDVIVNASNNANVDDPDSIGLEISIKLSIIEIQGLSVDKTHVIFVASAHCSSLYKTNFTFTVSPGLNTPSPSVSFSICTSLIIRLGNKPPLMALLIFNRPLPNIPFKLS